MCTSRAEIHVFRGLQNDREGKFKAGFLTFAKASFTKEILEEIIMKNTTEYRATIHTLTIEPILNADFTGKEGLWWNTVYAYDLPYINERYRTKDGVQRIIINPHRLHTNADGTKYIFTYQGLQEHLDDMQRICDEMELDGYFIRRLDICLDAAVPYTQTQKCTRLIALMLGEQFKGENRYISTDPITLDPKTIRIDNEHRDRNGKKVPATQQVEHYNRALKDQSDYENKPIINRFELRSMGQFAGERYDEKAIVKRWLERFSDLSKSDMDKLCHKINERLAEAYKDYERVSGEAAAPRLNSFLKMHAGHIYTRAQMTELLSMLGKARPRDSVYDLSAK